MNTIWQLPLDQQPNSNSLLYGEGPFHECDPLLSCSPLSPSGGGSSSKVLVARTRSFIVALLCIRVFRFSPAIYSISKTPPEIQIDLPPTVHHGVRKKKKKM